MSIKIKFPHDELCRRAAVILGIRQSNVISVFATEGGQKFHVLYFGGTRRHVWDANPKTSAVLTIWQIIDALPLTDVSGSVETIWSKGIESILEILGLSAMPRSEKELKRAYRRAALKVHPDSGGSEDSFRELRAAYESVMIMLPNLRGGG
jgi:hypothetical protein